MPQIVATHTPVATREPAPGNQPEPTPAIAAATAQP